MKAAFLIVALLLSACGREAFVQTEFAGSTMGTQYNVKLVTAAEIDAEGTMQDTIQAALDDVETTLSTYMPDSEISLFNAAQTTDWVPASSWFCDSVERSLELSALTDGAFDITVGPLVNLWGFGPGESIAEPPSDDDVAALLDKVGYRHLEADCARPALRKDLPELVLDMSAFGKGYAADGLGDWLDKMGFENYLVEVGGELRVRGHNAQGEKWAIGIELPLVDQRRPHAVVHLTDTAVATSGDYRNFFEADGARYSHTIDTRTGKPVTHALASVTVVDAKGYRADALATALLVLGPEEGMQLATRENLAVLFLLRDETGFDERVSPAFQQLRES